MCGVLSNTPTVESVSLPDITIRQLEYLIAVSSSTTWADAAARVGVSPSALSQGLAELERRLGVPLFESVGRRRLVRAEATPVVDHARAVLAMTGDLARWALEHRDGKLGAVRVGMIDSAAVHHFPAVVREYRREFPDVQLKLAVASSSDLLATLQAGELDIMVGVKPPAPIAGLVVEPLFEDPLFVVPPPGKSAHDAPSTWGPWLMFPDGSHTRRVIIEELRRLGAPLEIVAESHQPEVIARMAEMGIGWAVLPVESRGPSADESMLCSRHLVMVRRGDAIDVAAVDEFGKRVLAAAKTSAL